MPLAGETESTLAGTANVFPLLAAPLTVTTMLPVVAPLGTATVMKLVLQLEAVPAVNPLNVTLLEPWVLPKLLPAIVTEVPTVPEAGERYVIAGVTVKGTPLLTWPLMVTTTLPEVAALGTATVMLVELQLEAALALTPLKVTVLLPWLAPKPAPVMVTVVPIGAVAGVRLVMLDPRT